MNCKLAIGGPLCAALLLGCSSAPKLAEASGPWSDLNAPARAKDVKTTTAALQTTAWLPPVAVTPNSALNTAVATPAKAVSFAAPAPTQAPIVPSKPAVPLVVAAPAPKAALPATPWVPPVVVGQTAPVDIGAPVLATPVAPAKSVTLATPSVPPVTVVAAAPLQAKAAPVPKQVWEAKVGSSLRSSIGVWAARAQYSVNWVAEDLDYPIEAPLRFEGSFEDAVAAIFRLYEKAPRSFIVDGRRKQSRLEITEDKTKRLPQ